MTSQNKDDNAVDQKQQPFLEHIVELRSRILRSLGFVAVLFLPIYYFAEPLFAWVANPLMSRLPAGAGICLLYTSPSPRDGLLSRMPSSA